ncbi:MAG TPA: glycosyltransferase family 2 protein [Nocardioidaceae bacterium]|nr:glycosyltransferase family 2 protein [Nocardioidaceae bacterium]
MTSTASGGQTAYPYDEFSELAGPYVEPGADYRVEFVPIMGLGRRLRAYGLVALALLFEATFLLWLLQPSHYPQDDGTWKHWLSLAMVVSIGTIEALRLLNVGTLALATLNARDPRPVREESGTRVAFLTTIVPGNEPIEMAETTLTAALNVRHDGRYDVWLLDEGNDPDVKAMCARLGVHHFSRKGRPEYNRPSGAFKAKTKHGNYNAWLDSHGDDYDFWVSVDTDHVPHPNFAERLLGYFRDPDVAFVVGPQVYGNYDNLVTRSAESQQYLFHGVIQRAGNRFGTAMFVGTNNAVRISALRAIGGLSDSITEDAATSITWHSRRNPATGDQWKSVYTPDVLAVGEGPSSWSDYFVQQGRWARGTDEVVIRKFWTGTRGLPAARRLHYALLMSYYPSAALAWVLGCINIATYLLTGVGGVVVSAQLWFMLYTNAALLQLGIYFWNRRNNVSPHEEEGSSGVAGMFVSVLSAPIYVDSLVRAVRNKSTSFKVTPKGDDGTRDHLGVFSRNLGWAAFLGAALVASVPLHHDHPFMRMWGLLSLLICLMPVGLWQAGVLRARLRPPGAAQPVPARAGSSFSVAAPPAAAAQEPARHLIPAASGPTGLAAGRAPSVWEHSAQTSSRPLLVALRDDDIETLSDPWVRSAARTASHGSMHASTESSSR